MDGKLIINEEEAKAIHVIYDQYVHTDMGANGIAKYLENHGIRKIKRQNGKNPLFDAHLIRLILKNPVYCGKIAYGHRKTEKVHGTRNDYHLVEQDNYILVNGLHEAIIDESVWQAAQVKLVGNPKFAAMMQEKINSKVDTTAIDEEFSEYEKRLRQLYSVKSKLMEEIDSLDPDDRHYIKCKADLDDRLYRMYDKIEDVETKLTETRAKKQTVEAEKLTGDNIYKVLIYFEKLYAVMNEVERRQFSVFGE